MNNTTNFLANVKATPTFPEVDRLPISEKIEWGFITCSADWIIRFYSIFDNSTKEITQSLLEAIRCCWSWDWLTLKDEFYKEELEDLNKQLCSIVKNSSKNSSLQEYGIRLNSLEQRDEMLREIILADKRNISAIIYLLWGPVKIKNKVTGEYEVKQKPSSKYEWIRVFTKEEKDPVRGVVKLADGSSISLTEYIDNYDLNPDEVKIEEGIEEVEETSVRDYFRKRAGL